MGTIDVGEALRRPLEIMTDNYGFFIPPAIPAAVDLVSSLTAGKPEVGFGISTTGALLSLISFILSIIAGGALVHMADEELKGHPASYMEGLNAAFGKIIDLTIASLIIGIGFFIGLFLLVIPGLLWLMLTAFVIPLIMIENLGAIDAIKESINLTTGRFGEVLVYLIVLVIIVGLVWVILSFIPYIGSALATIVLTPYAAISITIAYRHLTESESGETSAEAF